MDSGISELYEQVKLGLDDIENGNTKPFHEAMNHIRNERKSNEVNKQKLRLREKVLQVEQERTDGAETISVMEARKRLRECRTSRDC